MKKNIQKSRLGTGALAVLAGATAFASTAIAEANISQGVAATAISTESVDEASSMAYVDTYNELQVAVESINSKLGFSDLTDSQREAAIAAAMMSGDARSSLGTSVAPAIATENYNVIDGSMPVGSKRVAAEAYHERDAENMAENSTIYNLTSTRPSDFVEAIFPVITIDPNESGLQVTVSMRYVQNDIKRNISGSVTDFQRRSLVRASIDSSILADDTTSIVPVFRTGGANASDANFVDPADFAPYTVLNAGQPVVTSYLAMGAEVDLIGISQTDDLLSSGVMNRTDDLDVDLSVESILIKADDGTAADIIRVNTSGISSAAFSNSRQGSTQGMTLNTVTNSVMINKDTVQAAAGAALVALEPIVTGEFTVHLSVSLTGNADRETGTAVVYGNKLEVFAVSNAAGDKIPTDSGPGATIAALFDDSSILGWNPEARRTNVNRRQQGLNLSRGQFVEEHFVPLRPPITTVRPTNQEAKTADLHDLIAATKMQMENEAIAKVRRTADILRNFVSTVDNGEDFPDILGTGRFYLKPTFYEETIDIVDALDTIKSHERAEDVRGHIMNTIRDLAARMYINSGYQAAARVLNPVNGDQKPTLVVATDPYIGAQLTDYNREGMLPEAFNWKIVTNDNLDMIGKIYLLFTNMDSTRNSELNPLSFGATAYAPELVFNLNVERDGQTSHELAVHPRWKQIANSPVMSVITVTNLENVWSKLT